MILSIYEVIIERETMRVTIVCVGKVKEKYLKDAIEEYIKRISRFCKVDIVGVPDREIPERSNDSVGTKIKEQEGQDILKKIKPGSTVIALDIKGKMLDSYELATKLSDYFISGSSHINFVIGGSLGLSGEVLNRADFRLSFSKMTFPHQLMRVILLEQVYRSFKILNNETYHK